MSYRGNQGRFRGGDRGGDRGARGGPRGRGGGGPSRGGPRQPGGVFSPGPPADLDARLRDQSEDGLVQSLKSLRIADNDLPTRPDFGKNGLPIKLRANFFPITIKTPKGLVYEYDVAITPAAGSSARRVKRRIFQLAEMTREWEQNGLKGNVAHDHAAKLYAARKLSQPLAISVPYYDEDENGPKPGGKEYTLTIQFIQPIDIAPLMQYLSGHPQYKNYDIQPIIAALNVVLAAFPNRTSTGGGVLVGRNKFFFPTQGPPMSLGGGLEAWRGFYSSVRPTHRQLMVNVNVCTTAFYKPQNLAQAMLEYQQASFGARYATFVKGVRVQTTHLQYRKTVKTVSNMTPAQYRFDTPEYGNVSVEEYFRKKYKITLKYPSLPLVDVGGQKSNFLPPELCQILPRQSYGGKLSEEHTANMITVACKPPNVNGQEIVDRGLRELGFHGGSEQLSTFGISVGTQMAVVPGRILKPPSIRYGRGTPEVDDRASWNLRNVKFAAPGKVNSWAVLSIRDGGRDEFNGPNDPELTKVINGFAAMCRQCGITMPAQNPAVVEAQLPPKNRDSITRDQAINVIRNVLRSIPKPQVYLIILSNSDKHIYSGIKHLCDSYLDVTTHCVHAAKIRKERGQPQYFANVALKLNMKSGGVNHGVDQIGWLNEKPTMLVGMDVTHPGKGSVKGTPSIAAVVASIDKNFAQFPASLRIQESRKEMITDLRDMMVERLVLFQKRNGNKPPERVLVYRDGVSEGQFNTVIREELPEMKKAFAKFNTGQKPYNPALTIVICGKRHHTRFYPMDVAHAAHDGNPKPGTVVDRGITAVYEFDFFLQAHGGLQGTTKPTHYYVVHDENGFKADGLQGITNAVSYLFARATRAVSLVSPAYYADLACERGRCYIHKLLQGVTSDGRTATSINEDEVMASATSMWHGGVAGQLKETMFYL